MSSGFKKYLKELFKMDKAMSKLWRDISNREVDTLRKSIFIYRNPITNRVGAVHEKA